MTLHKCGSFDFCINDADSVPSHWEPVAPLLVMVWHRLGVKQRINKAHTLGLLAKGKCVEF